jgi:hypothetical protein
MIWKEFKPVKIANGILEYDQGYKGSALQVFNSY